MSEFNFPNSAKALQKENGVAFNNRAQKLETKDQVQELVAEIVKCENLSYLNLAGNSVGVDVAEAIGKALEKHSELKKAIWKDMFTGRLKDEIPKALDSMGQGIIFASAQLTVLDCSDNALGPNGMLGLEGLLRSKSCYSLQELKLNNCGLGISGGKMLAKALLQCHSTSNEAGNPLKLKIFVAGRNRLENEGAKVLGVLFATLKTLEEISIPQNSIYFEGIKHLCEGFKLNKDMQVLNLNDNTIGSKGASYLSDAFYTMQRLRDINFGDCLLKTKGAILLAEALQDGHSDLEAINFGYNEIGANGGLSIINALQNKSKLRKIILGGNHFGTDGRERIKELLNQYNLFDKLNSLSEDEISDEEEIEVEEIDEHEEGDGEEDTEESEEETDADNYTLESEDEETGNRNYITALSEKRLETSLNDSHDRFSNSYEYLFSNVIETFCNTRNPSIRMFIDIQATYGLDSIKNHFKDHVKEDYVICIMFTILKCSALSEESVDALDLVRDLYMEAFKYAQETNQVPQLTNFFLLQLGLLRCENQKFKPIYNLKSCRYALREVMENTIFPSKVRNTFQVFLNEMT